MTPTPSDRDRLRLAFAELNQHGIATRSGVTTDPGSGHALLRAELTARFPHGLGDYVFWTRSDEQRFDATGDLNAALSLHCSSEEVAATVDAVCRSVGVGHVRDRTAVVRIGPRGGMTSAPSRVPGERAAQSPWRWLTPRGAAPAR